MISFNGAESKADSEAKKDDKKEDKENGGNLLPSLPTVSYVVSNQGLVIY